jgi:alginate O-acetyltransferase complex protein AlgJ
MSKSFARLTFVALLFGCIAVVPLLQWRQGFPTLRLSQFDLPHDKSVWKKALAVNVQMLARMQRFEDQLDEQSQVTDLVLPTAQLLLSRYGGVGNAEACIGQDNWLFYRPDVQYLTGEPFLARSTAAIAVVDEFHDQLAQRGIVLVVVPIPLKPMLHRDKLGADSPPPLHNASFETWKQALRVKGTLIFDPLEHLTAEYFAFLRTDTHWRPQTADLVAEKLAVFLQASGLLAHRAPLGLVRRSQELTALGDIAIMLRLPDDQAYIAPETVRIEQVLTARGEFWQPTPDADVLLLGDSFSNIFSLDAMHWGEAAGMAEQLSFHLQRPVDAIRRNDEGAIATRRLLSRELARGRDRLTGKTIVVWEFAARELAFGDWAPVQLRLQAAPPSHFLNLKTGQRQIVRGQIAAISAVPAPGASPYRDHIVTVHLVDLPGPQNEALVYLRSMIDGELTPAARLRVNDHVQLQLQPWLNVEGQLGALNRSELDDIDVELQEPCWGELIKP